MRPSARRARALPRECYYASGMDSHPCRSNIAECLFRCGAGPRRAPWHNRGASCDGRSAAQRASLIVLVAGRWRVVTGHKVDLSRGCEIAGARSLVICPGTPRRLKVTLQGPPCLADSASQRTRWLVRSFHLDLYFASAPVIRDQSCELCVILCTYSHRSLPSS